MDKHLGTDVIEQIRKMYLEYFENKVIELQSLGMRKGESLEREAQKYAIKQTTLHCFSTLDPNYKAKAWSIIYATHVGRKSGVDVTAETVQKVISADQSWKKSSGHAFEEVIKELTNKALYQTGIDVLLQRDVLPLINSGAIHNISEDLDWLVPQIKSSVFDLFVIKDGYIFGCIQAKTSIRDRVTRDREPSMHAMNHLFWSIVIALDGAFLKLPKFNFMVNGGNEVYRDNGWHGLYAFTLPNETLNHRINLLDNDLTIFHNHAMNAAHDWFTNRQLLNKAWLPKP